MRVQCRRMKLCGKKSEAPCKNDFPYKCETRFDLWKNTFAPHSFLLPLRYASRQRQSSPNELIIQKDAAFSQENIKRLTGQCFFSCLAVVLHVLI